MNVLGPGLSPVASEPEVHPGGIIDSAVTDGVVVLSVYTLTLPSLRLCLCIHKGPVTASSTPHHPTHQACISAGGLSSVIAHGAYPSWTLILYLLSQLGSCSCIVIEHWLGKAQGRMNGMDRYYHQVFVL